MSQVIDPKTTSPYEHDCPNICIGGVSICFSNHGVGRRGACWTLMVSREASEEDLAENNILNEIGESIWTFEAEISYCPYCGLKLKFPDPELAEDHDRALPTTDSDSEYGDFTLFDQEKWTGRLR